MLQQDRPWSHGRVASEALTSCMTTRLATQARGQATSLAASLQMPCCSGWRRMSAFLEMPFRCYVLFPWRLIAPWAPLVSGRFCRGEATPYLAPPREGAVPARRGWPASSVLDARWSVVAHAPVRRLAQATQATHVTQAAQATPDTSNPGHAGHAGHTGYASPQATLGTQATQLRQTTSNNDKGR